MLYFFSLRVLYVNIGVIDTASMDIVTVYFAINMLTMLIPPLFLV